VLLIEEAAVCFQELKQLCVPKRESSFVFPGDETAVRALQQLYVPAPCIRGTRINALVCVLTSCIML